MQTVLFVCIDPCGLPVQTVHIEASELPRYFAIVSRFTRQVETVIPDGALTSLSHGVKVAFPPESCWKATNIKLQVDQALDHIMGGVRTQHRRILSPAS